MKTIPLPRAASAAACSRSHVTSAGPNADVASSSTTTAGSSANTFAMATNWRAATDRSRTGLWGRSPASRGREQFFGLGSHPAPENGAQPGQRLAVEVNVLHDGQVRDERQFLEHHPDPLARRLVRVAGLEPLPSQEDLALVRYDHP